MENVSYLWGNEKKSLQTHDCLEGGGGGSSKLFSQFGVFYLKKMCKSVQKWILNMCSLICVSEGGGDNLKPSALCSSVGLLFSNG